jgi:hypothetical protein
MNCMEAIDRMEYCYGVIERYDGYFSVKEPKPRVERKRKPQSVARIMVPVVPEWGGTDPTFDVIG